jgi:mevalonate-3-kinase
LEDAAEFIETVAYPTFGTILLGGLSDQIRRMPLHTSAGLAYTDLGEGIETRTVVYLKKGEPRGYFNGAPLQFSEEYRSPFSVMNEYKDKILGRFGLDNSYSLCFDSKNKGILSGSSDSGAAALGKSIMELYPEDLDSTAFENRLRVVSESVGRSLYGGLTVTWAGDETCRTEKVLSAEDFSDYVILGCRFNEKRKPSDDIHTNIVKSSGYSGRVSGTRTKAEALVKLAKSMDLDSIFEMSMVDTDEYHALNESVGVRIITKEMDNVRKAVREYRSRGWATYIITGGTNVFVPVHRSDQSDLRDYLKEYCPDIVNLKVAGEARVIGKSF